MLDVDDEVRRLDHVSKIAKGLRRVMALGEQGANGGIAAPNPLETALRAGGEVDSEQGSRHCETAGDRDKTSNHGLESGGATRRYRHAGSTFLYPRSV